MKLVAAALAAVLPVLVASPTFGACKVKRCLASFLNNLDRRVTTLEGKPGVPGPQGPKGDKGDKGDPGPGARWALVADNGTILAQSGGISLTPGSPQGEYILNFGSSQAGKTIQVNVACLDSSCFTGLAAGAGLCGGGTIGRTCMTPGSNDTSHVLIFTYDTTTTNANLFAAPFFISTFPQ